MNKILKDRLKRINLAIEKGINCNVETGEVYNKNKKKISSKNIEGYIVFKFRHEGILYTLLAHQFIFYIANKKVVDQIDHINGKRFDNRKVNLRSVTHKENHYNRTKSKGYCWVERAKAWKSQIKINGKDKGLGYFKEEKLARSAYSYAKIKVHGVKTSDYESCLFLINLNKKIKDNLDKKIKEINI